MCVAYPMKVLEIKGETAIVALGQSRQEANIELVENVSVGDYVIVHAGFAIQKLDPAEAQKTLEIFAEIEKKLAGNG